MPFGLCMKCVQIREMVPYAATERRGFGEIYAPVCEETNGSILSRVRVQSQQAEIGKHFRELGI